MEEYENNLNSHILEDGLIELPLRIIEILEDICIQVVDIRGCTIYYSKGCEKIEQYKREDILGKNICETYKIDENTELNADNSVILGVLQTGKPVINKVMRFITLKGKLVNVVTSAYPIFSNNKILGAIAVFKDLSQITEMSSAIRQLQDDLLSLRKIQSQNGTQFYFDDIIGSSAVIKSTIALAKKISVCSSSILIVGATGTGKELFAQSIHNYGPVLLRLSYIVIKLTALPVPK